MKNKNRPYSNIILISQLLTFLFLQGKIIDIPKGTHKGGIIGAIGVSVILVFTTLLILLIRRLNERKHKKNDSTIS